MSCGAEHFGERLHQPRPCRCALAALEQGQLLGDIALALAGDARVSAGSRGVAVQAVAGGAGPGLGRAGLGIAPGGLAIGDGRVSSGAVCDGRVVRQRRRPWSGRKRPRHGRNGETGKTKDASVAHAKAPGISRNSGRAAWRRTASAQGRGIIVAAEDGQALLLLPCEAGQGLRRACR